MSHVEAIHRHGAFEPLGPVNLEEEQRVRLSIERAEEETWDLVFPEVVNVIWKKHRQ